MCKVVIRKVYGSNTDRGAVAGLGWAESRLNSLSVLFMKLKGRRHGNKNFLISFNTLCHNEF